MLPVHVGTLVMMGIHLIDNADFDSLAEKCQEAFALRVHVLDGAADSRARNRLAGESDRDFLILPELAAFEGRIERSVSFLFYFADDAIVIGISNFSDCGILQIVSLHS